MEKKMYVTYSDGLGLVRVEIDESGITSDGTYMFFSDTEGRDYKIASVNVFSITME